MDKVELSGFSTEEMCFLGCGTAGDDSVRHRVLGFTGRVGTDPSPGRFWTTIRRAIQYPGSSAVADSKMKFRAAFLTLLSVVTLPLASFADTTVVITGGNASKGVLFDRAEALLSGFTKVNGTNSSIRSYKNGTIASQPGLGKVTIHFVLNGAALGLANLRDQAAVGTASGGSLVPQAAVSSVQPETVGIDGSIYTTFQTAVVPFVYIKNPNLPNSIHGVTNLTQRQASYLESASGALPTAFFGGESTNDPIYLVGRDTGSAVRLVLDANVYFSDTPSFWVTNKAPNPPLPPIRDIVTFGLPTGGDVTNNLTVIPNAIGTVSAGDVGGFTPLAFEGIPFSSANVANGSYPLWGYESWYTLTGGTGVPSGPQQTVINLLLGLIKDSSYQHTNSNFVGKFVPLGDLQVSRTVDGGPISSTIY